MSWRFHDKAEVDPENPRCWATCGRCGCQTNLYKMSFQQQWAGPSLLNLNLIVCDSCLDKPAPFLKTLVLPPDPPPVLNARPEPYSIDETDFRATQDGITRVTEDGLNDRIVESGDY